MLTDVVIANKTYAKLVTSNNATLDDIAIKVIKQDIPDFLLPMKIIDIDGETEFRYEIGEGTRLSYISDSMSKRDFVALLENMIRPFQTCNDWFLDYHNFCLDSKYIIVGRNCTSVRYIYIPDDEHKVLEEDILNFFRDFILNMNLSDEPAYVMNLYRHIKEKNSSLVAMLEFLNHETEVNKSSVSVESAVPKQEKKSSILGAGMNYVNNRVAKEPEAPKSTPIEKVKPEVEQMMQSPSHGEFGKEDVKNDLINNLFGDTEDEPKKKDKKAKAEKVVKEKPAKGSGGLFGGLFGGVKSDASTPIAVPQSKPINTAINREPVKGAKQSTPEPVEFTPYYGGEDVTIISDVQASVGDGTKLTLQLIEDRGYQFPKYIEIDLSRGFATVGRYDKSGRAQADYNFDASLSFVSRRQLRIERNENQYKIIDLDSGNGTLVNDQPLVPNMPYELNIGDRIIISKNHRIVYKVC